MSVTIVVHKSTPLKLLCVLISEVAGGGVLQKKVFLKTSQISQKKHLCWSSSLQLY